MLQKIKKKTDDPFCSEKNGKLKDGFVDRQTDRHTMVILYDPLVRQGSNKQHYRFGSVECSSVTDVSEDNEDISKGISHKSRKTATFKTFLKDILYFQIINTLVTIIHMMRPVLDGAKWIVSRNI